MIGYLAKCPRVLYKRASPFRFTVTRGELHITCSPTSEALQIYATACTMRFITLSFLLILTCLCLAYAQVSYDDCCFKYVKKMNTRTQKHAVDYRMQVMDGGCNIPAVIFTMRRGRVFCTDPKDEWVTDLMKKIDQKKRGRYFGNKHFNKYHP